jgi:hypothetical protein
MVGRLTLIGSGETAPGMVRVHRALLDELGEPPRAVFLDTPAGFELGLDAIRTRFHDYFERQLGLSLDICRFTGRDASLQEQGAALQALAGANYILAGPGSPTYAARQLAGSSVFDAVMRRWEAGAHLVFASAAAIAISRYSLPVYEIYKAGGELRWTEGLDLLGPRGFPLAIVTHWNNAEGGTHDTRACFMGMERFARLEALLPAEAVVLGIDEHTACTLDLMLGESVVRGAGGVAIRRGFVEQRVEIGETFSLEMLRGGEASGLDEKAPPMFPAQSDVASVSKRLEAGDLVGALREAASLTPGTMGVVLHQAAEQASLVQATDDALAPFVALLIDVRRELRARGEWAAADALRDRVLSLGIELRDAPQGTVWERKGQRN